MGKHDAARRILRESAGHIGHSLPDLLAVIIIAVVDDDTDDEKATTLLYAAPAGTLEEKRRIVAQLLETHRDLSDDLPPES